MSLQSKFGVVSIATILEQGNVNKFTKLSKIVFSMECFTNDKFVFWVAVWVLTSNPRSLSLELFGNWFKSLGLFIVITLSEVYNFAEVNTLYSFNKELEEVFRNLETDSNNVLTWFNINSSKANPGMYRKAAHKLHILGRSIWQLKRLSF